MAVRQETDKAMDLEARSRQRRGSVEKKDASPDAQVLDDDEYEERYCICRGFDEGFMIACDGGSNNWFHLDCVGLTKKEQEQIDKYICASCVELGIGPTIWKAGIARRTSGPSVRAPPAAVEDVWKQYEKDAKLGKRLQNARSRRAARQPAELRKTKGPDNIGLETAFRRPSTSHVTRKAKTPLERVRKDRGPQKRLSRSNVSTSSSSILRAQPTTPPSRPEPSSQQQSELHETTLSLLREVEGVVDDEMSQTMDIEDTQKEEDAKALKLERLEHTFAYQLVREKMMENLFGSAMYVIMEGAVEGIQKSDERHASADEQRMLTESKDIDKESGQTLRTED